MDTSLKARMAPHLGLLTIAGIVEDAGHSAEVVNENVAAHVPSPDTDLVGISTTVDSLTASQRRMLNMLFDGFKGNLTSSKWAKICKVSQDTASREINALVTKGILRQEGCGRSTHYVLVGRSFRQDLVVD